MNWELLSSIKLKNGRVEEGRIGRVEGWKCWKDGRMGEVLMSYNLSLIS